jgi:anti-sigma B factor antagonist
MTLQIDRREAQGITVLGLRGRLVLGDAGLHLAQSVRQLVAQPNPNILLNIEQLAFIDSSGVGDLIANFTTVRKSGGTLKLSCPNGQVRKVLEIVKLPTIIEVFPSEKEALDSFARTD